MGGTLIFSYIGRLGLFFFFFLGGSKFRFFFFWGGVQKNEYSFGYEDFVHVTLGSSQNWAIFRDHFYAF